MANTQNFDFGGSFFPSGSQTPATYTTSDQYNEDCLGIKLVIDVTAVSGSLTVTIQGKDRVSSKYWTILASAALSSTGTTVLTVYPGLTAAANVTANDHLPATWRLSMVVATTSCTATIGGCLLV